MTDKTHGLKIKIRGIVQGVGFRPFIYGLAKRYNLTGWVKNTSNGVEIEVQGTYASQLLFLNAIRSELPELARIDELESMDCPYAAYSAFKISSSQPQSGDFLPVSPDVSICSDCQKELFDPNDRRFGYPFINCTNCGPRFSIIKDIPYDRELTTMAGFQMCSQCQAEYDNPADRRFHAQPTACPICGPQLCYEVSGVQIGERGTALRMARTALKEGKIVAIKGLGGFHLACDAHNSQAVSELRLRKKRSDKPFALMAFDIQTIHRHCAVNSAEEKILTSRQHPIVLLERKCGSSIAPETSPNQSTSGIMLPYTPLHLLLMQPQEGFPEILVMTSGNLSEEPIAYEDGDALHRLSQLADAFLFHDRSIYMRVDDSVARIIRDQPLLIRRSRGYAPDSVLLPDHIPQILATGAELKNTFCLTRDRYAFVSHHIGDLENYETLQSFEQGIAHFERLFRIQPEIFSCDLHPDYLASRYAQIRSETSGVPLIKVQHHHAHLSACLVDNAWKTDDAVIGLSFDGTGYGTDGAIWGSEVLFGGYRGYQRMAHLKYVPLPGGDASVRKPARMALAHLWGSGIEWDADLLPVAALAAEERSTVLAQLNHPHNSPLTSSMGRLFDAASALLGIRQTSSYEGQAAIEIEAIAADGENGSYDFDDVGGIIDPSRVWRGLIADWRSGVHTAILAARFHNSIVNQITQTCQNIRSQTGCSVIALSGGVWQNRYLFERTLINLERSGFRVLTHHQLPANDGCIALGQALVAARSIR